MVDVTYQRDAQKIGEKNKNFKGEIMGLYLNPREDKGKWVENNGESTSNIDFDEIPEGKILVCMVDSGAFYAIAVAYSKNEAEYFASPSDNREKWWYYLDRDIAKSVSDNQSWNSYMGEL